MLRAEILISTLVLDIGLKEDSEDSVPSLGAACRHIYKPFCRILSKVLKMFLYHNELRSTREQLQWNFWKGEHVLYVTQYSSSAQSRSF